MAIFASNGSQSDVATQIGLASSGDTVTVPAGTFTWGTGNVQLAINKSIILQGAGTASTTIVIYNGSLTYGSGTISVSVDNVTIRDMSITTAGPQTPISFYDCNGGRVTNINWSSTSPTQQYFLYAQNASGLTDNCIISGNTGDSELIFVRGAVNAWQNAPTMGTSNAWYIEDCSFTGNGYVCDANSNAKIVVRFNTITNASAKVDGHGIASNGGPRRGVRHMEVYNNHWTATVGYASEGEFRGGSGVWFDNISDNTQSGWVGFTEYGSTGLYFTSWITPNNYPVVDGIGCGPDVIIPVTSCVNNGVYIINTVGNTIFTSIGATDNNVGTVFIATGPGTGTGYVSYTPAGGEPWYVIHNTLNGSNWALTWGAPNSSAITAYGSSFTMGPTAPCMVHADIDFFDYVPSGFNGSTGTGRGTKAQMLAITPSKTGVGFWVTDEANWRNGYSNSSGQLYTWNGSSWVLKYTPYTYPHPLRGGGGGQAFSLKRLGSRLKFHVWG